MWLWPAGAAKSKRGPRNCYRPNPSWTDSAILITTQVLTDLSGLYHLVPPKPCEAGIVCILQMGKWRPREVEGLAHSHTAWGKERWDSNPGFTLNPMFLSRTPPGSQS